MSIDISSLFVGGLLNKKGKYSCDN